MATTHSDSEITTNRRTLAILLSLPICGVGVAGLGHFVLGRYGRGVVAFVLVLGVMFAAMLSLPKIGLAAMGIWPIVWLATSIDVALVRSDGRPLPTTGKVVLAWAALFGASISCAFAVRVMVVEAFKIPSGAMVPTLMVGDHVFVNKHAYGLVSHGAPRRGDVAVFKFPENPKQDFVKRVVALPGDRLEAVNGRPVLNGKLVPHCKVGPFSYEGRTAEVFVEFLDDAAYLTQFDRDPDTTSCNGAADCACRGGICGTVQGPFEVGPSEAWVMGDNRDNSFDSRSWRGGLGAGVPFENFKGRVGYVWMSFGPGGIASERIGVNLTEPPRLPGASGALGSALENCLRTRPTNP